MSLESLVPVIMIIMGFVNAWLIWLATEGKKERASIDQRIGEIKQTLAEFEIRIARDYARIDMLREIKDTISLSIERLTERIDRLVEWRAGPPAS